MLKIIMVTALYITLYLVDFKPNYKTNGKKLNIIYIALSVTGFALLVLYVLEIPLPSLADLF